MASNEDAECQHVDDEVIEWMASHGFGYTDEIDGLLKSNHKIFVSETHGYIFAEQATFFYRAAHPEPVDKPHSTHVDNGPGEDQKVVEWAKNLGFWYDAADQLWIDKNGLEYTPHAINLFYEAQQADRKRLLDKVASDVIGANEGDLAGCIPEEESRNGLRAEELAALDQIRKEEL
jgi:hypothetical protein